jgi:signal peptidase II
MAQDAFPPGGGSEAAPFLNFVLVRNTGAAFSMLSGTGAGQGVKMALIALLAMIPLAVFYRQAGDRDRLTLVSVGAILGGAVGNIHDRLRYGAVTDFLDFHWGASHWPAFNLADVFVVLGIAWILWATLSSAFRGGAGPAGAGGSPGQGKSRGHGKAPGSGARGGSGPGSGAAGGSGSPGKGKRKKAGKRG